MIRSDVQLADTGHGLEALGVAGRDRLSSSRTGPPESAAIATFGPTPLTEMRWRNRSRSSSLAKP